MSKYKKAIFIITLIIFFIILYLLLTMEDEPSVQVSLINKIENQSEERKNLVQQEIADNYKISLVENFKKYSEIISREKFAQEDLETIKINTLALKVPAAFKDLHINFILSIDKMEKYLISGDVVDKNSGNAIILTLKTNYSWLND